MGNEVKVKIEEEVKTLEILNGSALPQREPEKLKIGGTINAVTKFLEKRINEIDEKKAHIIVDRAQMFIHFVFDETSYFKGKIIGTLEFHPDFKKFRINTGESWSAKELSEFVKMNRSFFKDRQTAMKLSTTLQEVKINVSKELEKSDNNRGDYKAMVVQKVISSTIPERFNIILPVFKGEKAKEFEVEIYVSPDTYAVTLFSPDANDLVEEIKNSAIDNQLTAIKEIAKDIVIIEQ